MPQVPYQPFPTEKPTGQGLPDVRVPVIGEAFGTGVAEATSSFGRGLQRATDELWRKAVEIQQLQNRADADIADSNYIEAAGKLQVDYETLQGKDAVGALDKHITALRETREGLRGTLGSPEARRLYDSQTRGMLAREVVRAAAHARVQNNHYLDGASDARIKSAMDYTYAQPDDTGSFDQGLKMIESEVRRKGERKGASPEQIEWETKQQQGSLIALRIASTARTDPTAAKALLEQYRDRIGFKELDHVEKIVLTQARSVDSRIIADEVGSRDPTEPIEKVVAAGKKKWDERYPDDPAGADYVEQRIRGNRAKIQQDKRERDFDNRETLQGTLIGARLDSKLPTTLEELFAMNPRAQQAWENSDTNVQKAVLNQLQQNARKEKVTMTPERLARWAELKGIADGDPEKFLNTDILVEDLPIAEKKELFNLQQRKRRNVEQDPRVTRALGQLVPMMEASQLLKTQNEKDYYEFRGRLQDALEIYNKEKPGKQPTYQEIQEIGSRLIREQKHTWFFGMFNTTSPMYKVPVPDKDRAAIEADYMVETGRKPSEFEVKRLYFMKKYKDLYGGQPTTSPSTPAPAAVPPPQ